MFAIYKFVSLQKKYLVLSGHKDNQCLDWIGYGHSATIFQSIEQVETALEVHKLLTTRQLYIYSLKTGESKTWREIR